ncbi:MAG: hypothetical protein ACRDRR_09610 [Pseudonocardiaceae bacterium]
MSTWIAALVAVAAITATYLLCVRPTMRGRCTTGGPPTGDAETERQLAELREELRMLRTQQSLDSGRVPVDRPTSQPDH